MCLEDTIDVALAREDDAITLLADVQTIEFIEHAKAFEGQLRLRWKLEALANLAINFLGKSFVGASKSKVVNLTKHEDPVSIDGCRIDQSIMGGAFETELGGFKDGSCVPFPKFPSIRMPLQSMEDGRTREQFNLCLNQCLHQLAYALSMETKVGVSGGSECA